MVSVGIIHCLKNGISSNILPVLAHYGSLLCYRKEYKKGYRIANIALEISHEYPDLHLKVELYNRAGLWCQIYGKRLIDIQALFEEDDVLWPDNN